MPRDDEPNKIYRFKSELPPDLRDHSFYRHYPATEEEYLAEIEEFMRKFAAENPDLYDENGSVRVRTAHERNGPSPAVTALDLTAFARKFAGDLIASVAPAQLLAWAAPARLKSAHSRPNGGRPPGGGVFSPRFPEFVPERHERYLPAIGTRSFCPIAIAAGRTAQFGSQMRNEILLTALAKGQPIAMSIVTPTLIHPPQGEPELAAGIFPTLWTTHERALSECEERGLIWDQPAPLLPPRARLIFDFWRRATELKSSIGTQGSGCYRALFVGGLAPIIDAAREEMKRR